MPDAKNPRHFDGRVVVVEDESYTRTILVEALASRGINAAGADDAGSAMRLVKAHDPHVVIADLDLGAGPSGADLLNRLHQDRPWLGLVVLTGHSDPQLALPTRTRLPQRCIYLVKSSVDDLDTIIAAVESSLQVTSGSHQEQRRANDPRRVQLTATQGAILRLIGQGLSNEAIATERGTSRRAAEMQVHRVFSALGVANEDGRNARVLAARMWRDGRITIR